MFGAAGWRHLEWWRSRRAWKAKLKAAFARVAQAEYVEMLSETNMGKAYLAIKPRFGRAAWIEDARDSVEWGKQVGLYLLHRLRANGHDLRTVTCHYWWTTHDGMCCCEPERYFAQTPARWMFQCKINEGPQAKFWCQVEELRGRQFREKVEGMDRDGRWAEAMRWLDGGGGWEDRGGMLMAVLDLVCSVTKV
jgi:hypothetical protein